MLTSKEMGFSVSLGRPAGFWLASVFDCRIPRFISTVGNDNFSYYDCSEDNEPAAFRADRASCPGWLSF